VLLRRQLARLELPTLEEIGIGLVLLRGALATSTLNGIRQLVPKRQSFGSKPMIPVKLHHHCELVHEETRNIKGKCKHEII